MQAYLIEAGRYLVLYVKERQQYFTVSSNAEYLQQFVSGDLCCHQWEGGQSFQMDRLPFVDNRQEPGKKCCLGDNVSKEGILKLFYLPESNSGAVIAMRDSNEAKPSIYHSRRFIDIKSQYFK